MKIVVTGCNGSVGRRVVRLALSYGYTVLGLDLVPPTPTPASSTPTASVGSSLPSSALYRFIQIDLKDYDKLIEVLSTFGGSSEHASSRTSDTGNKINIGGLIHLAAIPTPMDFKVHSHNTNVVLSWNVLHACGELGIPRIAQASSTNVVRMVYANSNQFFYFPIDEEHPCEPDEPYGLSKVIAELQAQTLARRYPALRIASLRFHCSVPHVSTAAAASHTNPLLSAKDLWGYAQEDEVARAFLLALRPAEELPTCAPPSANANANANGRNAPGGVVPERSSKGWESGHEAFLIVSPRAALREGAGMDTKSLRETYWPGVPIGKGKDVSGDRGFFDCGKAARILGWVHGDDA